MTSTRLNLLITASMLIDALVFLAVMFAPWSRFKHRNALTAPWSARRITQAIIATIAIFFCRLPLMPWLGVDAFGLIRLCYANLVILVPALGLFILITTRFTRTRNPGPRITRGVKLVAAVALLPAPVGLYASYFEPHHLRLETAVVSLPPDRTGSEQIRVGVLADIQTDYVTNYERGAVERLMAERPDIVVITGDLFQGPSADWPREMPAFRELLRRLDAPGGVYMVLGDVDWPYRIETLIKDTPVRLLINQVIEVTIGDRRLAIGGIELGPGTSAGSKRTIEALESADGKDDIRILLAHRPDAVLRLPPRSRIDLVVSGHTHGGQVVLPFFGPPLTLSKVPRSVAAGGLHELNGNRIYISRGIGCEHGQSPRLRFLCPPEVSLLRLDNRHRAM